MYPPKIPENSRWNAHILIVFKCCIAASSQHCKDSIFIWLGECWKQLWFTLLWYIFGRKERRHICIFAGLLLTLKDRPLQQLWWIYRKQFQGMASLQPLLDFLLVRIACLRSWPLDSYRSKAAAPTHSLHKSQVWPWQSMVGRVTVYKSYLQAKKKARLPTKASPAPVVSTTSSSTGAPDTRTLPPSLPSTSAPSAP